MSKNNNDLLLELQRLRTENRFLSRDLESFHQETKYWRELYDLSIKKSAETVWVLLLFCILIVPAVLVLLFS
jgi:hypothetical protein